jgi:hypothetical protein
MSQLKNWREDFKDLKPTVVGTGAAIYAAVLIVIFFLVMPSSTSSPSPDITVRETDYRVLAPAVWSSGYHEVNLVNDGKVAHELVMFKTDLTGAQLLTDPSTAVVPSTGKLNEDSDKLVSVLDSGNTVLPGTSRVVPSGPLTPGHYVLMCDLPGHYILGMREDVTVKP